MADKIFKGLSSEYGTTYISDHVVAITAGLAATEVEGVASMSGGVADGIAHRLGRKNLSRGIKVDVRDEDCVIDVYIIVKYGVKIPDVCKKIRENTRTTVEETVGFKVTAVNIHVQGLSIDEQEDEDMADEAGGI
jgi:uncharacterized alkaline shock family protein YloU